MAPKRSRAAATSRSTSAISRMLVGTREAAGRPPLRSRRAWARGSWDRGSRSRRSRQSARSRARSSVRARGRRRSPARCGRERDRARRWRAGRDGAGGTGGGVCVPFRSGGGHPVRSADDRRPRWPVVCCSSPRTITLTSRASCSRCGAATGCPDDPRRDDIVFAAREHDNGWREADAAPRVDRDSGEPYGFLSLPAADRIEIWRRGIHRYRERRPYAALLIHQHALALHAALGAGDEYAELLGEVRVSRDELLEASGHRRGGRARRLSVDPAHRHAVAGGLPLLPGERERGRPSGSGARTATW